MRNDQVLPAEANALYPGLGLFCGAAPVSPLHPLKERLYPAESRECPAEAPCRRRSCGGTGEDCEKEKSVIAEPVFVFEKRERACKRHAEDLAHSQKAENDFCGCPEKRARSSSFTYRPSYSQSTADGNGSEKRVRSSSFTVLPTFPPSQLVTKNNIFMPSTLFQMSVSSTNTEREPSSQTQERKVLRPAVLQLPLQVLLCEEVKTEVSENISVKDKSNNEFSSVTTEKAMGPHICLDVSNLQRLRSQPAEDTAPADGSSLGFVFGENMLERVLSPQKSSESPFETYQCKKEATLCTEPCQKSSTQPKIIPIKNITLVESAAAYISKSSHNCMLKKVDVLTGEEAERNVLQINCKLFVFNKLTQSWTERGRGSLRLNDTSSNKCGTLQSRLVMRHQGSLRLIFNTKLWAQMKIDRANRKCLCMTATDLGNHSVQVFLIQASAKDIGRMYAAIHHRLVALQSSTGQDSDSNQMDPEPEAGSQQLTYDSDDEEDEEVTQTGSSLADHSRWIRRQPILYS
ncbi:ran-binding protein 3-like isoform X2 [Rhinatrema bivittatum]|uniref:ran-binding protein 3-like isoform X2 n=1 Tax=Rhinatrema bivittatum TaxID=194408 RepID=UPI001128B377|nr:ran-binding protein 3-like isoform X2 [Rhinatrema bivittatum]